MGENRIGLSEVIVIDKYFNEDYSWNNFINCINDAYDLNDSNNRVEGSKEVIGKINFWQKLTMTLDNIDNKNFPGIQNKLEKLKALHYSLKGSGNCTGYFGAVSLTDKEPTTGKHSDPIDVIYSQFIGSVKWTIFDDNESKTFTLNPGDIIYVPKSVVHEVKSSNPRAAISFMFEAS
jgi:mannose-6-phosphate isomerase-like protein (cupin superfamily)